MKKWKNAGGYTWYMEFVCLIFDRDGYIILFYTILYKLGCGPQDVVQGIKVV